MINATNVGMISNQKLSIVDSNLLTPNLTVMDIVYNPLETKLLADAREVGAKKKFHSTHLYLIIFRKLTPSAC